MSFFVPYNTTGIRKKTALKQLKKQLCTTSLYIRPYLTPTRSAYYQTSLNTSTRPENRIHVLNPAFFLIQKKHFVFHGKFLIKMRPLPKRRLPGFYNYL